MRIAFCCDLHFTAKNEIRIIEGLNFLEYIFDYCVKIVPWKIKHYLCIKMIYLTLKT